MKMKFCIALLLAFVSLHIFSQNSTDSIVSIIDTMQVIVRLDTNNRWVLETKDWLLDKKELQSQIEKMEKEMEELKKENCKLEELERDIENLKRDTANLYESQREADRRLINIVSNFLYIPYEAFSIDSVAIPAGKAIASQEFKNINSIKVTLVENYKKDIEDVSNFIKYAAKKLNNPFEKNAKDILDEFKKYSFYETYIKYDRWQNTFLGKQISEIEKQLNAFDGNKNKIDFSGIQKQLNECLKTTTVK